MKQNDQTSSSVSHSPLDTWSDVVSFPDHHVGLGTRLGPMIVSRRRIGKGAGDARLVQWCLGIPKMAVPQLPNPLSVIRLENPRLAEGIVYMFGHAIKYSRVANWSISRHSYLPECWSYGLETVPLCSSLSS